MNDENFINLNTKIHFSKQILNSLLSDNNNNLLSKKDRIEIQRIRSTMNNLLLSGLIISSASYFTFNKFILKNKKLSFLFYSRIKIMRPLTDYVFIIGLSYTMGKIHNNYLNTKIFKNLNSIQKNYRYLIKNFILTNGMSIKENKFDRDLMTRIHQYDYSQVYFVSLLLFRLFI